MKDNEDEKSNISEILREADSLLESSENLLRESRDSDEDIKFLIEQYHSNKRWFSEKPGRVTIEDVIKRCYEFGRAKGRTFK